MCGFIAQLVEHRTGIAEVMGSNPVEALIFFRLLLSNTCIRSSGLPVGSHSIVGWLAQKSGHRIPASPYWITSSDLALGVI